MPQRKTPPPSQPSRPPNSPKGKKQVAHIPSKQSFWHGRVYVYVYFIHGYCTSILIIHKGIQPSPVFNLESLMISVFSGGGRGGRYTYLSSETQTHHLIALFIALRYPRSRKTVLGISKFRHNLVYNFLVSNPPTPSTSTPKTTTPPNPPTPPHSTSKQQHPNNNINTLTTSKGKWGGGARSGLLLTSPFPQCGGIGGWGWGGGLEGDGGG